MSAPMIASGTQTAVGIPIAAFIAIGLGSCAILTGVFVATMSSGIHTLAQLSVGPQLASLL